MMCYQWKPLNMVSPEALLDSRLCTLTLNQLLYPSCVECARLPGAAFINISSLPKQQITAHRSVVRTHIVCNIKTKHPQTHSTQNHRCGDMQWRWVCHQHGRDDREWHVLYMAMLAWMDE